MHSHCYLCSHLCLNLSWKLQTVLAVQSLAFSRAVRTLQDLDGRGKAAWQALWLTVPTARTPCSGQAKQTFCTHQCFCSLSRWNCRCTIRSNRKAVWGPTGSREPSRILACTNSDAPMAPTADTFVSHAEGTTWQGGFVTTFLHCGHTAWNGSERLPRRGAVTHGQGGAGTADGGAAAFTLLLAVV